MTIKEKIYRLLRWSEQYTKTDMVYAGKSGFWLILGQAVGVLVALGLTIAFANFLSQEVFGIYKYILSMVGFFTVFSLTGMNAVITKSVAQGYDGTFKYSLLTQLKWAVPVFSSLVLFGLYYLSQGNTSYAVAFFIASFFAPISTVANSYNAYLHGKQDFRTATYYNSVSTVLYGVFMFSVVFFTPKVIPLITTYFAFHATINVYFCFRTLKKNPPKKPFLRDEDLKYGKHLSLMNIAGSLAQQVDTLVVYHLLGPAQLAIFTFSTILPDRIKTIFNTLASAALPKLSEKNRGGWDSLMVKTKQLSALALTIAIAYIIVAPYAYELLFPQYMSSVFYSQIYVFSLLLLPTYVSVPSLLAKQKERALYVLSVILPIVKICMSIVMIFLWGILGAVLARIIYNGIYLFVSLFYARKV